MTSSERHNPHGFVPNLDQSTILEYTPAADKETVINTVGDHVRQKNILTWERIVEGSIRYLKETPDPRAKVVVTLDAFPKEGKSSVAERLAQDLAGELGRINVYMWDVYDSFELAKKYGVVDSETIPMSAEDYKRAAFLDYRILEGFLYLPKKGVLIREGSRRTQELISQTGIVIGEPRDDLKSLTQLIQKSHDRPWRFLVTRLSTGEEFRRHNTASWEKLRLASADELQRIAQEEGFIETDSPDESHAAYERANPNGARKQMWLFLANQRALIGRDIAGYAVEDIVITDPHIIPALALSQASDGKLYELIDAQLIPPYVIDRLKLDSDVRFRNLLLGQDPDFLPENVEIHELENTPLPSEIKKAGAGVILRTLRSYKGNLQLEFAQKGTVIRVPKASWVNGKTVRETIPVTVS